MSENEYKLDPEDIKDYVFLVKVGNDERPAGTQDIENAKALFEGVPELKNCRFIVTHHAIQLEKFPLRNNDGTYGKNGELYD